LHCVNISPKTSWCFLELAFSNGERAFGEVSSFGNERALIAEIENLDARLKSQKPVVMGGVFALVKQVQMTEVQRLLVVGLEQAMLDVMARSAGQSLSTLLGGPFRNEIECYANINRGIADRSPEGFARQASRVVASGYRAIKIAPFDGYRWNAGTRSSRMQAFSVGIARIGAVRDAVGGSVDILIDCHARFDLAGAAELIRATQPFELFWIEEPVDFECCDAEPIRKLRHLAHVNGVRFAGGEQLCTVSDTIRMLDREVCDVILPDLRLSGVRNAISMLDYAVERGVAASLHNPVGPVLDAISRQVAAALPSFLVLERQVGESPLFDRLRGAEVVMQNGNVQLDGGDGFGFELDRDVLAEVSGRPDEMLANFAGVGGAGPDA
jgi:galactonate dehydratase